MIATTDRAAVSDGDGAALNVPQVVFTAPDPIAPLAVGPTSGALLYIAGAEVQIGEIKNGWAWIKTGPGRLDGPGFVPLSVLEAV